MTPPGPAQVVVVTGASAGVGRAIVRAYASRGARLGLLARGRDGLEAARREVENAGAQALGVPTDVGDAEQVEAAAQAVEETLGPIDVWVNNAMVSVFSPVRAMTAGEFRRVTEVTYLGCVHGTLAALRRMLPRDRGLIVQVGSALAFRAIPLQAAYSAAKHALQGFTEALRCELLHDGSRVRVAIVHLPALNTPQFAWVKTRLPRKAQPVPPIFQPELAAEAVLWAADHDDPEIWVGGSTARAIVASRLAGRLVDRYLARNGFAIQQHDGPEDPHRPHNLWEPLPGDRGAHGDFDARARSRSLLWWLRKHRPWVAAAGAGLAGLIAFRLGGGRRAPRGARARRRLAA